MGCFSMPLVTSHASIWERAHWKHLERGPFKRKNNNNLFTFKAGQSESTEIPFPTVQLIREDDFFLTISRSRLFPHDSFACVQQSVLWRVKYFGEYPLRHFYFREHQRQQRDPKHLHSESNAERAKAFSDCQSEQSNRRVECSSSSLREWHLTHF